MMAKVKMVALMSIRATPERPAIKRGAAFEASEQEARDLSRMGQAKRDETAPVEASAPAGKPGK